MRPRAKALLSALALLAAGCDSPALDEPDAVRTWAVTGSAVGVWSNVHDVFAFADGQDAFADPKCPEVSDDGTTFVVRGGCNDSTGVVWTGTATIERSGAERSLDLRAFGHFQPDQRATRTGTAKLTETGPAAHDFEIGLVVEGGMKTTLSYRGSVAGDYDTPTVWNGSGQVERDGLASPTGQVTVTTVDERVDDATCSGQPVSGTTTIEADGDEAVVTYDGATDCDADKAARWSFDGEDRGKLTGITCSVGAAGAPSAASWAPLAAVVAALFASLRRRQRASRRV